MLKDVDRVSRIPREEIEAVRAGAISDADDRRFPTYCAYCGRGGWLTAAEILADCQPCLEENGEGCFKILRECPEDQDFTLPAFDLSGFPDLVQYVESGGRPQGVEGPVPLDEAFRFYVTFRDGMRVSNMGREIACWPEPAPFQMAAAHLEDELWKLYDAKGPVEVHVTTPQEEPPADWPEDAFRGIDAGVWVRLRWLLDGWRQGAFEEFLELLAQPCPFAPAFRSLYEEYRGWEGTSLGHRTVAWDLLASLASPLFPEYEIFADLADDLEAYAATLEPEWASPGMDVGSLGDWREIELAAECYWDAEGDARLARAHALYRLAAGFEPFF